MVLSKRKKKTKDSNASAPTVVKQDKEAAKKSLPIDGNVKFSKSTTLAACFVGFVVLFAVAYYESEGRMAAMILNETPNPSTDVMVSSFPKCGSFWTRFLMASVIQLLKTDSTSQVNFETIETLIPDLELGPNRRSFVDHEPIYPGLRLFKSHQPYHATPITPSAKSLMWGGKPNCQTEVGLGMEQAQCNCPNCPTRFKKVVLIVRDGRSALCSYYKFQSSLKNFEGNFSRFLRDEEASSYGKTWSGWYESWAAAAAAGEVRFVGSSWKKFNLLNQAEGGGAEVFVLRYEDLKADAIKALADVMDFVWTGESPAVTNKILQRSVEDNDFESMKRKELRDGGGKHFKKHYPKAVEEGFGILRQGDSKGYPECFDEEDELFFMEQMGGRGMMEAFGYV